MKSSEACPPTFAAAKFARATRFATRAEAEQLCGFKLSVCNTESQSLDKSYYLLYFRHLDTADDAVDAVLHALLREVSIITRFVYGVCICISVTV